MHKTRTQCQRISVCLDLLWSCRFLAITIDPSLSPWIIIVGTSPRSKPSLPYRFLSQQACIRKPSGSLDVLAGLKLLFGARLGSLRLA
jgi:hypothetical protein